LWMVCAVLFQYQKHMLAVPVVVGDVETTFIFDTGIGVDLISPGLAASAGCVLLGETYTGRRMSGQAVTVPMSTLGSLKLGDYTRENVAIGVFDLAGIAGLVSLASFRSTAVTIDCEAGAIVIEDERSLADRMARGTPVAIGVHEDGPYSADVFIDLTLPGGRSVKAEVDTGSDNLILNQPFAAQNAIDLDKRTQYDELAELACMSALATWLRRWQPVAIQGAMLAGGRPETVAGAPGNSLQMAFDRWHEWASRQREFIFDGRPGITDDEYDMVAERFAAVGLTVG
jgi:Aspartyl protease